MPNGDLWITGNALESAIQDERPVLITYVAAAGEQSTRTIEPYELAETGRGHLIVRAMDRRSGKYRAFRLDRITHLNLLRGPFQLDHPVIDTERAALARIRAEIACIDECGYRSDAARWIPDDTLYAR
jgi:predicted DNA-binding transcriptional regulator YafY